MDIFYTYLLLDPRNFYSPFYVGKGKNERCQDHLSATKGKNRLKNSVIRKIQDTGMSVAIMKWKENISEGEAFCIEKQLISRFGRRDNGTGILTNLTDGGEGGSGIVFSAERKEKCRQRMLGEKNPMYGETHTDETRQKIKAANYGKIGKPHTEHHKHKMKIDNHGGIVTSKIIFQFDSDGNFIAKWKSANNAAKTLKLSKGNICQVATTFKQRKTGNSYWRYEQDSEDVKDGKLYPPICGLEFLQIDESGNIIKKWNNVTEAAKTVNRSQSSVSKAIKLGNLCGGYFWKRCDIHSELPNATDAWNNSSDAISYFSDSLGGNDAA